MRILHCIYRRGDHLECSRCAKPRSVCDEGVHRWTDPDNYEAVFGHGGYVHCYSNEAPVVEVMGS